MTRIDVILVLTALVESGLQQKNQNIKEEKKAYDTKQCKDLGISKGLKRLDSSRHRLFELPL